LDAPSPTLGLQVFGRFAGFTADHILAMKGGGFLTCFFVQNEKNLIQQWILSNVSSNLTTLEVADSSRDQKNFISQTLEVTNKTLRKFRVTFSFTIPKKVTFEELPG